MYNLNGDTKHLHTNILAVLVNKSTTYPWLAYNNTSKKAVLNLKFVNIQSVLVKQDMEGDETIMTTPTIETYT